MHDSLELLTTENVYIEDWFKTLGEHLPTIITLISEELFKRYLMYKLKSLVKTPWEIPEFLKKVLELLHGAYQAIKEYYWRADTQMMLAYSEDGVSNSSGVGFVFKGSGTKPGSKGVGLIHLGASYQFINIDHLQMGLNHGSPRPSTLVIEALKGEYGKIP